VKFKGYDKHISRVLIIIFILSLIVIFSAWAENNNSDLLTAAKKGRTDTVKTLLDNGAEVNAKNNYGGQMALMDAAETGHTDIMKVLLEKDADINAKDNRGRTALMWAAKNTDTKIVELLKLAGAKK
jgi:ankyrin repeat protein